MIPNQQHIYIEIDKLTNSIENIRTGDSFPTDVLLVSNVDLKGITKKAGWVFNQCGKKKICMLFQICNCMLFRICNPKTRNIGIFNSATGRAAGIENPTS